MNEEVENIKLARDTENEEFKIFLRGLDPGVIDDLVFNIQERVTAAIDCTSCGNCCRSLMINVEEEEIAPIAFRLNTTPQAIRDRYIEESAQGMMVINTIPCHFLHQNKCSVYEDRFNECREFPHLHKKGFTRRLFGTFMHYGRCPIIYNTIELLKQQTNFVYTSTAHGE